MSDETFYCSCGDDFDELDILEIHKRTCSIFKEVENHESTKPKVGKMPVAGQQILGNSWGNAGQMANKRPHLVPISDRKIEQER